MNEKNNQADKKPSVRNCTEELLGELFKNVSMGKESLLNVMPKVKNDELRAELTEQLDRYSDFCRQIKDMLDDLLFEVREYFENADPRQTLSPTRADTMIKN